MLLPMIFDVNEHDFTHKVLDASRDKPVMVDFWAEWCPPCRALTPVLERVVHQRRDVRLAKVDADENMRLAGRYQLRGFPTVILFRNGEELGRFSSARSPQWVQAFLDQHLVAEAASPTPP